MIEREHLTPEELDDQPASKRLRQIVTNLSLVSHVPGVSYDSSGGGGSISDKSGSVPPGGPDRKGDREDSFRQKSHLVFLRRYAGLVRRLPALSVKNSESIRDEILSDAEAALRDWKVTPDVPGRDPDHGTFEWKVRVANDERSSRVVAGHYGVSHVTVLRYREQYRGLRA